MNGKRPALARRGFRLAVLVVAALYVLALMAGAFVLSYSGMRATVLTAGVNPGLSRVYPAMFDGVFVVACAAAVTLRGVLRGYAWLTILVVAGSVATADAVHALSITVPRRPLELAAAIVPWVVVLVGLTLLYAIVRRTRPGRDGHDEGSAASGAAPPVPLTALLTGAAARPGSTPGTTTAPEPAMATPTEQPLPGEHTLPGGKPLPGGEPAFADAPAFAGEPFTDDEAIIVMEREDEHVPQRDDPSDADAGPFDLSEHFARLHSSPAPPAD